MPDRSARSRYLLPLVVQVWLGLPIAAGWEPGMPWWVALLSAAISLVLLGYAARNVVRLWRSPAAEAGWRAVVAYLLVGGLFSLVATSMVLDSLRWESRIEGLVLLPFGLALLTLAAREGRRTVTRSRVPA